MKVTKKGNSKLSILSEDVYIFCMASTPFTISSETGRVLTSSLECFKQVLLFLKQYFKKTFATTAPLKTKTTL